ncbi:MAG: glycosyltransferase [Rhodoferax sp.]|nr:glycosyltransferase [Rhodoferax sp.]
MMDYRLTPNQISESKMSTGAKIAIVIPYYKPDYLEPLLDALQREADARINIYLFDDCSPTPALAYVRKYQYTIHKHIRFDSNLGGASLTGQWDRCLAHIGEEEWVWFLPDDDVLKAGSLTKICDVIDSVPQDVALLHFATEIINGDGCDQGFRDTLPAGRYDAVNFYYRVLRGESMITLGSQLCRRSALHDGFVKFPRGWGSDHATTLKSASQQDILHIDNATLQFRMSELNISSQNGDWAQKAAARVQFAKWLVAFLQLADSKTVTFSQVRAAFLLKGESFFVRTCPLRWRMLGYAYAVAKTFGSGLAAVYPLKIVLIKAITAVKVG